MACGATLKRTLDFDPLLSPASPKRRRCAPLSAPTSAAASPSSAAAATAASFSAAAASPQKYLRMEPSPFGDVSSRLTTGGTRRRGLGEVVGQSARGQVLGAATPLDHGDTMGDGPRWPREVWCDRAGPARHCEEEEDPWVWGGMTGIGAFPWSIGPRRK